MNTNRVKTVIKKSTLIFILPHLHLFCQSICEIHFHVCMCVYVHALYTYFVCVCTVRFTYLRANKTPSGLLQFSMIWWGNILLGMVCYDCVENSLKEFHNKCFLIPKVVQLSSKFFLTSLHCCDCFICIWLPIKLPDIRYRLLVCLSTCLPVCLSACLLVSGHCLFSAPDAESWHYLSSPD